MKPLSENRPIAPIPLRLYPKYGTISGEYSLEKDTERIRKYFDSSPVTASQNIRPEINGLPPYARPDLIYSLYNHPSSYPPLIPQDYLDYYRQLYSRSSSTLAFGGDNSCFTNRCSETLPEKYLRPETLLFNPYHKPKRMRTAYTPMQLLQLELAFEKNHFVVGNERKQLAEDLKLTEIQVKVWFQNRRTKHKRTHKQEDGETCHKKEPITSSEEKSEAQYTLEEETTSEGHEKQLAVKNSMCYSSNVEELAISNLNFQEINEKTITGDKSVNCSTKTKELPISNVNFSERGGEKAIPMYYSSNDEKLDISNLNYSKNNEKDNIDDSSVCCSSNVKELVISNLNCSPM